MAKPTQPLPLQLALVVKCEGSYIVWIKINVPELPKTQAQIAKEELLVAEAKNKEKVDCVGDIISMIQNKYACTLPYHPECRGNKCFVIQDLPNCRILPLDKVTIGKYAIMIHNKVMEDGRLVSIEDWPRTGAFTPAYWKTYYPDTDDISPYQSPANPSSVSVTPSRSTSTAGSHSTRYTPYRIPCTTPIVLAKTVDPNVSINDFFASIIRPNDFQETQTKMESYRDALEADGYGIVEDLLGDVEWTKYNILPGHLVRIRHRLGL
jgi:hypothetical protein